MFGVMSSINFLSTLATNSHADISLFVLNIDGIMVYLLVYVNDIIITCDNDGVMQKKLILTLA